MSKKLTLMLYSLPKAWARPGQNANYRYDTQKRLKNDLGAMLRSQLTNHTTLTGFVHCRANFIFPVPKTPKLQKRFGQYHILKPDIDNLLKFYLDLCKDLGVYKDDCQICSLEAVKRYECEKDGFNSGVILTFTEIDSTITLLQEEEDGNIFRESGGAKFN